MSVQTSSATVDPPPLLFGQRSPSPPSFTSPPLSPNHIHAPQSPLSVPQPPMDNEEDVDMSTSVTLPHPNGQNHDRDGDTQMDGVEETTASQEGSDSSDEDGSDTSSEDSAASAQSQPMEVVDVPAGAAAPVPPPPGDLAAVNAIPPPVATGSEPVNGTPATATDPNAPVVNASEVPADSAADDFYRPPNADGTLQPPPAVPVVEPPVPEANRMNEDSSSDDEEDGGPRWHPIQEDTSSPDDRELKEIEGLPEFSALDHTHWEQKTLSELDDPEYSQGAGGRIEWTITNYNGTKEKPNKELVMKSPTVNIGGYDWRIKFYPRGNDSDYLSIYIENVTVAKNKVPPPPAPITTPTTGQQSEETVQSESSVPAVPAVPSTSTAPETPTETQATPLPLLNVKPLPKRKSVAAQASVVLYNPGEPRVNYFKSCLHRFCPDSPDWGWTRFHGPYYEIQHRHRGLRQALLRNDTLSFTAYIQVVEDDTGCLWEHDGRENQWDSFAMTGLQGLAVPEHGPGGNLISAISSWLLMKPFREFLYRFDLPSADEKPFERPKVLIWALQKVLYMMRTQVQPKDGPVGLEDITDALEYYGIDSRVEKQDVVEIWDILRIKIDQELEGTGLESEFADLMGVRKDFSTGIPSYRASVKDCESVQEAVQKADGMLLPNQRPPRILTIELGRQIFDESSRSWKKLVSKATLDDQITVGGASYTLYGFVVHKDHLQSGLYSSVLRPCGPNSKWYTFKDGKDENKVICLTKKQAIEAHEGIAGSSPSKSNGNATVAYIVMYVRDDADKPGFTSPGDEEPWNMDGYTLEEVVRVKDMDIMIPDRLVIEPKPPSRWKDPANDKAFEYQVYDSRVYTDHAGPGIVDFYDAKWLPDAKSEFVFPVTLKGSDTIRDIRRKIAEAAKVDELRCRIWLVDSSPQGQSAGEGSPHLVATGPLEFPPVVVGTPDETFYLGEFKEHCAESRIWLHIVDEKDVPLPPPPPSMPVAPSEPSGNSMPVAQSAPSPPPIPAPVELPPLGTIVTSEDTPMSEPDDTPPADQNMAGVVTEEVQDENQPPAVGTVPPPPSGDTEMGGTQGGIPPPPAFGNVDAAPPPPPPPPEAAFQDEIYLFLKYFETDTQRLISRGSYIAKKSDIIMNFVLERLNLPSDASLELFEEEDLITANPIPRPRRTFSQNDIQNRCIIIATQPLNETQKASLEARAAFADPQSYLDFHAKQRNFPHMSTGNFKFDYFSGQFYEGTMRKHHPHGHGRHIYFSGDVYVGSLQLSQRHGHGLMTYANSNTYDGEWEHDLKHGQGTFTEHETGNSYTGGWKQDRKFGEGVTRWKVAQETERLCRVCWDEPAEAAFYDCGHVVACLACARGVEICPVCRKRVVNAMKLYFV